MAEAKPIRLRDDCTVTLVDSMGTEDSIATKARVSNNSKASEHSEKANKGLIRALMRDGHGTPFESVVLDWYLEVPIFLSRQIVKTRISSINEASGRYVEFDPVFYVPSFERPWVQVGKTMDYQFQENDEDTLEKAADYRDALKAHCAQWYEMYMGARVSGIAKEIARMGMPVNTYTSMRVQFNLRTTLNFIALRMYKEGADRVSHPQWEIDKLVATKMRDIIAEKFPTVWEAFEANKWRKL